MTEICWFHIIRLTPVVLNDKKTAFFVKNLIKIYRNHSFTKMRMKISYACNSYVIWQYHPCDMYIHLHTIGLIGMTELGTVTFILRQIGVDFTGRFLGGYYCVEKISSVKFKVELKFIWAEFQIFQRLENMMSSFQWVFLTEIGPWPRIFIVIIIITIIIIIVMFIINIITIANNVTIPYKYHSYYYYSYYYHSYHYYHYYRSTWYSWLIQCHQTPRILP